MRTMPSPQILNLAELQILRGNAAAQGRNVVLTNGCFDILHRGHVEYLNQSATFGDYLFVAVNSDQSVRELKGPSRPINNEQDRAYLIANLKCVTAVFIFSGPRLADEINLLRPDIYTKAGDYTLETLEPSERHALEAVGSTIHFLPFVQGYSTTNTILKLP